jgi:short-subunit dehydrogenase
MNSFQNKNVLITGGASGIGKIMGRLALERGANLIVWDINQEGIDAVMNEFSGKGKILGFRVDVSDVEQIRKAAEEVKKQAGFVDILINNAGVVAGKYFHEHSDAEISRSMHINAIAPLFVTKAFLGDMLERNSGAICNIASLAGLISNPRMSVYAASKWSVIGWSDSLRIEMQQLKKNIRVTTIMPYYINTGMFDGVHSLIPVLEPEKTAHKIIRAIEKRKIMQGIPFGYNFIRFWQGVFPVKFFDWLVGKQLGIYKSMEHFTGRKKIE